MYTRFTTLTNELKSLGRIILEEEKVEKILTRVLPVSWESKITTIQESKNIATLRLDELIGNLTTYELRRQTMKMDTPKKERSLALRIAEGLDLEDDEMAMITREFKKKKEHVQPKRNKGSTKAMVAAWGETSDEDSEDEAEEEQTLMAIGESDDEQEVQVKGSSQIWYMDSGCSKHVTGNKDQFLSLEDLKGGDVSFGNGKKGEIIGVGKIGKTDSHSIENVYLIDGLKYSLISVSQLCDKGNLVAFTSTKCFVINLTTDKIVLQGKRVNNIYIVDLLLSQKMNSLA
ncbi:uncharacterized protein [Nicotiana sylvestris]|uniref:uncharacterized protein n=1 Tax=Nicotiana sylvestris TaxID=4096 RepID=UPI00388CD6A4